MYFLFSAAIGGLMGLGLGMSFISVIEIFYYLFFRRAFLWYRMNWRGRKMEPSPIYVTEFKKTVNASNKKTHLPQKSPIQTISSPTLDINLALVRQGSLNLPAHLQARLNKY